MLEWKPYAADDAALLAYRGTVTSDDYDAVAGEIDRFLSERDRAHLLIDLTDFEGIGPRAVLDDLQLTTGHLDDFGRVAVVTDERWQTEMMKLSDVFTRGEVRTYAPGEREQAERWARG